MVVEVALKHFQLDEEIENSRVLRGRVLDDSPVIPNTQVLVMKYEGENARDHLTTTVRATSRHQSQYLMNVIGYCIVTERSYYLLATHSDGVLLTRHHFAELTRSYCLAEKAALLVRFIQQVIEAVAFLHEKECAFVDLSPHNLLLFENNIIVMFSRVSTWTQPVHVNDQTYKYTAPELLLGNGCSAPSDSFSVACIFLELLSSKPLLPGVASFDEFRVTLTDHVNGTGVDPYDNLSFSEHILLSISLPELVGHFEPALDQYYRNRTSLSTFKQYLPNFTRCSVQWNRFPTVTDWLQQIERHSSMVEAMKCLVSCNIPKDRPDLIADKSEYKLTEEMMGRLCDKIRQTVAERYSQFLIGSRDYWDVFALFLYTTDKALVYKLLNAVMAGASWNVSEDCEPALPFFKRVYEAALRLGTTFNGSANRFVFADTNERMQFEFQNYATRFAEGKELRNYQIASFTKLKTLPAWDTPHRPIIVFRCDNLAAIDISEFSAIPKECEVIVPPPSVFTVVRTIAKQNRKKKVTRIEVIVRFDR
ncbi:protein kinase, putative [Bodo saltans]|uniref:Protein kinase, putative n=1 Tax=Bodo saltans TaxID=75058 RepID=A0A0S4JTX2_BODSA|nr:protein kinase, putative [Bodo saltans]|eukprot:CUG93668.1 protein kinase, putative [Bodo saltans]